MPQYVAPRYSRSEVNKAGDILISPDEHSFSENTWARAVLINWRASHSYPINTFQATLRSKLKRVCKGATVAQRLKRESSIVLKLRRFNGMRLARMQDIGGLRAIVPTVEDARKLEASYLRTHRFDHQISIHKNYIKEPKPDGYRSIHIAYRYRSRNNSAYQNLSVEIQIRTKLQHAWATAVETMGTFLGQALKSGFGDDAWRNFFLIASAALAVLEKSPPVPGFQGISKEEIFLALAKSENELHVLDKLRGFSIAADNIKTEQGGTRVSLNRGYYHLIVLNSERRSVSINSFSRDQLEEANLYYAHIEEQTKAGKQIEAVLVSVNSIQKLKKAYPNYFLDTQEFVKQIEKIIGLSALTAN